MTCYFLGKSGQGRRLRSPLYSDPKQLSASCRLLPVRQGHCSLTTSCPVLPSSPGPELEGLAVHRL